MGISQYIKEIGRGKQGARSLTREQAADLLGQVLDGQASDLEIGAFCVAMRIKGETAEEMCGFLDAVQARIARFPAGADGRPLIVLPSYNGARKLPVLTPLLALLLARQGQRVLLHGMRTEARRVLASDVLEALDVPALTATKQIANGEVVHVDTALLHPGLARLLATRETLGLRNPGHSVAKLLSPCDGPTLVVASYTHPAYFELLCATFSTLGMHALLSRGLDRNQFKVMGVIQKPDAVAKHASTSIFGAAVAVSESPKIEGLVYVGTDDGLIHVRENGAWRRVDSVPGVPGADGVTALVSSLKASKVVPGRVYATFDNSKMGDYKPYVFVSDDKGVTWRSISGDLPVRGTAHAFQEDFVNSNLLFVGTEFGAFFTLDGGEHWFKVPGLPTVEVHDMEVQERECDLVMATFGRGFYILEDYSLLRSVSSELFSHPAHLFPVRAAWNYVERSRVGNTTGRGWSGASYYSAPNPAFGATFTYYLKEKLKGLKEQRHDSEKKDGWQYPTLDALRAEDRTADPRVLAIIRDSHSAVVRQIEVSRDAGLHKAAWNLRYPKASPTSLESGSLDPWDSPTDGPMAPPGTYSIQIASLVNGVSTPLTEEQKFEVRDLPQATFRATNDTRDDKFAFEREAQALQREVEGAQRVVSEVDNRLALLRRAVMDTPGLSPETSAALEDLRVRLETAERALSGDPTDGRRMVAAQPSISERVGTTINSFYNTQPPTQTQREQYAIASEDFATQLAALKRIVTDVQAIEARMDAAGAPWTPSRLPVWPR